MSHPDPLSEWSTAVSTAFAHLSQPQATVLALWSYGMVLAKSCGITLVCASLALQLGCSEASLVQRLREWCYEAPAKRGAKRRALEVSTCFAPLLRWVLSRWPTDEPRLALALDATTLKKRFTVLTMSVLYRGCAIPVAWKVVGAEEHGSWRPHWIGLLTHVQGSIPAHWTVLVLTDRGLYARWLYEHICSLGWHPFMRINKQGYFRPLGQSPFRSLATAAPRPTSAWCGQVDCFSQESCRLRCTLLACWEEGSQEVWLVVTDLEPAQATVAWYGMRSWIEAGFKDYKRGGWQWHQTKMTDPKRAERLWLAIAVATFWVVSVGGQADASVPVSSLEALPATHVARRSASGRARPRLLSCFARGLLVIVGALLRGEGLRLGWFHPEPWPTASPAQTNVTTKCMPYGARLEAAP
jgi:Transposase DDE domain